MQQGDHQSTPQQNQKQNQKQYTYCQPTTQPYQYKIFIPECNTYIGSQLVQLFRNDDQIQVNPNIIVGTLNQHVKTVGSTPVNSVFDINDQATLNAVVKNSDIIVYALDHHNANTLQSILKYMGKTQHQGQIPQRFILISSLLPWNSPRNSSAVTPCLDNLPNRNSSQWYLLELENLCLNINNLDIGIESYVVAAGLVYGAGEGTLFPFFKRALAQDEKLIIVGTGTNNIPMVHVLDLGNVVVDLAFHGCVGGVKRDRVPLPKSRYYFAVDGAKNTQKQIINCIAQNLGNGQVQEIPIQNAFLFLNFDQITIDLQINDLPTLKNWHSKDGLIKNIEKIVSQFNLYRGLKPNKIFIMGPPAAGKSKIAEILQKSYGLPVLTVKKVLDQLQSELGQFANQIKTKIQQIRAQKIQEQKKIFQEAKKKKKGKKDAADQFDPSKVVPRLPDDQLVRVFKNRLEKSDCLNKGYILDGWPKNAKYCQALFTNQKGQLQQSKLPNTVFCISATEQEVKQRVKALPQNIKQTTHWNEQGTARRFQTFSKLNEQGNPKTFFQGKVDIKQVPFNYEGPKIFVQFVQRNGPLGFKKKQKIEKTDKENKDNQNQSKQKLQGQEQQNEQNEQKQPENMQQQNGQFDLQKLTQHQKQILNQKSRPIRQYLIDNVIPQITEGLLQICKQTPRDPIGFLIKFLETKEAIKRKK